MPRFLNTGGTHATENGQIVQRGQIIHTGIEELDKIFVNHFQPITEAEAKAQPNRVVVDRACKPDIAAERAKVQAAAEKLGLPAHTEETPTPANETPVEPPAEENTVPTTDVTSQFPKAAEAEVTVAKTDAGYWVTEVGEKEPAHEDAFGTKKATTAFIAALLQ